MIPISTKLDKRGAVQVDGSNPNSDRQTCFSRFFYDSRIMVLKVQENQISLCADMMSAMGAEPRLRIMRLLLSSYPGGMVVGEIQSELGIPKSTLSHHMEKLKVVGLVSVHRERQFLRYSANTEALKQLLAFLFDECCSRSQAIKPQIIANICHLDD